MRGTVTKKKNRWYIVYYIGSRTAALPDRPLLYPAGYPGSGRGWRLR